CQQLLLGPSQATARSHADGLIDDINYALGSRRDPKKTGGAIASACTVSRTIRKAARQVFSVRAWYGKFSFGWLGPSLRSPGQQRKILIAMPGLRRLSPDRPGCFW